MQEKNWVAAVGLGCALIASAEPSRAQPRTEAAPAPSAAAPAVAAPTVVDAVRARFSQTRGWFRIVADARFDVDARGALTPDYRSLHHPRVRASDAAGYSVLPTFAPRFDGASRVAIVGQRDLWVDVTPLGVQPSRARVEDGLVVYPDAWVDTDVMFKSTPTHVDEYLLLRTPRAPSTWRYRAALGEGLRTLRQTPGAVEVLDARGAARLRANRPFAIDAEGRRIEGEIRVVAGVIVLSVDLRDARYPVLVDPDWRPTADMAFGRFYNGANVLPDGRVLVTGGCSASVCSGDLTIPACRTLVGTAEALELTTRTWSRVSEDPVPRYFHVSESLADSSVLVAGGCTDPDCRATTADVRRFDPARGEFAAVGSLSAPRAGIASLRLRDGRILLAGGCDASTCSTRVEVFDPMTRTLRRVADLGVGRARATATLLADGRVLLAGGCSSITCAGVLASAEVYDPAADRWSATATPMRSARGGHYAVALEDGRVVLGGGCPDATCTRILGSSELWSPATGAFTDGPQMRVVRVGAQALRLPNGSVLVAQGCQTRTECDLTNELLDARATAFNLTDPALTIRAFHQTILHERSRQVISIGGCQPRTCSWWNETWDVSSLQPNPDAGVDAGPTVDASGPVDASGGADVVSVQDAASPRDVVSPRDAGATVDANAPPTVPRTSGNCGCRATSPAPGGAWAAAALAGLVARLRRGRRARRTRR